LSGGEARSLINAHGRDPHRPAWARGGGVENASQTSEKRDHAIVCSGCGQPATVPFRPNPSRPVYCGGCFRDRGRAERA
jgi:CxxC-x17-CxxC domain-containing protein